MYVCILEVSFPELEKMWFCDLSSLPRIYAIKKHVFEEFWNTTNLSSDLFKIFFLQFNFLWEYFIDCLFSCLDLFRILRLSFWEIESGNVWMLRYFLWLRNNRGSWLLEWSTRCGTSCSHLLLSLFYKLSHRLWISLSKLVNKGILWAWAAIRSWVYLISPPWNLLHWFGI